MGFEPLDHFAEVHVHHLKLPHWKQWGATYFVTARLADSVPDAVASEWRIKRDAWLRAHGFQATDGLDKLGDGERHKYHREFTQVFHKLLDAGHGECLLARRECAEILIRRLIAGHGTAYNLDAWCVMPNHFHALVAPGKKVTLGEIVRHWKGGSAFEINRALGRRGRLWQPEAFDHIVRSDAQLQHFRNYISENPIKAHLKGGYVLGVGTQTHVAPEKVVQGFNPQ